MASGPVPGSPGRKLARERAIIEYDPQIRPELEAAADKVDEVFDKAGIQSELVARTVLPSVVDLSVIEEQKGLKQKLDAEVKQRKQSELRKQAGAVRKRRTRAEKVETNAAGKEVAKPLPATIASLLLKPEAVNDSTYSNRTSKSLKAAVVASLYLGQPMGQIAAQYGLENDQVSHLKAKFDALGSVFRRDKLSDMLMVYIEQEIKSLMAISIATSNEKWIMGQNAGDMAMYVATKSDRLMQILQAFGRVTTEREQYVDQLEAVVQESKESE